MKDGDGGFCQSRGTLIAKIDNKQDCTYEWNGVHPDYTHIFWGPLLRCIETSIKTYLN